MDVGVLCRQAQPILTYLLFGENIFTNQMLKQKGINTTYNKIKEKNSFVMTPGVSTAGLYPQ